MVSFQAVDTYRQKGRELSIEEREKLARPFLPRPTAKRSRRRHKKRIRPLLRSSFYILLYYAIHLIFGTYIRIRTAYTAILNRALAILYYHHRTPELIQKDVRNLSRLPGHLSVILQLRPQEEDGGLERLTDEISELAAWCACASIPVLSIYEKSGIMKAHIPSLHTIINQKLSLYFGPDPSSPQKPHLRVSAPHHSAYTPAPSPNLAPMNSALVADDPSASTVHQQPTLHILLLSATDGRDTLVDLTRTLTEMAQSHKLSPRDISTELINAEISDVTAIPPPVSGQDLSSDRNGNGTEEFGASAGEPDLLIVFGPVVKLDGYPPWQVRLTEIHSTGDGAGRSVEYQSFLRSLWKYAGAEFRFGR